MKKKQVLRKKPGIFKNLFKRANKVGDRKLAERVTKVRRKSAFTKILSFVFILVILGTFSFGVYLAIKYAISLKSEKGTNLSSIGSVYGFEGIPQYQGSEFVFKDTLGNESVRKFLSTGKSIYRLPNKTTIADVYSYYASQLPTLGWEHVLSVPLESDTQRYGEYWVKSSKGLRISGKYNDVWYESIGEQQAREGLQEEVKTEKELALLLNTSEFEDLRPDFPWRLKVPSDYLITYKKSDMKEVLSVELKKYQTEDIVVIYPVGYHGADTENNQLNTYLTTLNTKTKSKWKTSSYQVYGYNGLVGIKGVMTNRGQRTDVYVVNNERNSINYAIYSTRTTNPLLKYVIEKIESTRSSYFETE